MAQCGKLEALSFEDLAARLPDAGLYQIMFRLGSPLACRVGALGQRLFPSGFYVYTGSAMRALAARVGRHLSSSKRTRWHIDYLLPPGRVVAVKAVPGPKAHECALHAGLGQRFQEGPTGFGSSDCRCRSHLVYLGAKGLQLEGFLPILHEYRP